jgi:hypothetical protein
MKVRIERCIGHLGVEMPLRFRFGRRDVEIVDQWYGSDYCYFKIEGSNDNYTFCASMRAVHSGSRRFPKPGGRPQPRLCHLRY